MHHYYVYILKDPATGLPFYVGKGSGNRCHHHTSAVKAGRSSENPYKDSVIKQILETGVDPVVEIYKSDLNEGDAYTIEQQLVTHYGRRSINTGPLTNLTCGGDRPPSAAGRTHTDEYKQRCILNLKGGMTGKHHSEEWKAQHTARHTGTKRSNETKAKISESKIGKSYDAIHGSEKADLIKMAKSESMKGKNTGPRSEETKAKIRETIRRNKLKKA